jgi:2-aminoadipate transaminase
MVKSLAVERAGSSAIRDLLEITERPGIVSLAGGLPNPATFPTEAIAAATAAALAEDPVAALQYGPTEGYRPLRRWIAERNGLGPWGEDQVLVTSGSQQALELATRALVDPGGMVALADPAYVGALQAFRAAGVELAAIPLADGLRVDVLADRLALASADARA